MLERLVIVEDGTFSNKTWVAIWPTLIGDNPSINMTARGRNPRLGIT